MTSSEMQRRHVRALPLLSVLILVLCQHSCLGFVPAVDLPAMLELKSLWGSTTDLSSWDPSNHCSKWTRVTCSSGRVSSLYMEQLQLPGPLPTVLANLTGLRAFYGATNKFSGTIPDVITTMTGLQMLRLNGNQFTGELPQGLSALKRLYRFLVGGNQLTGTIPSTWTGMRLQDAYFNSNNLGGAFPTVICTWTTLWKLRLGGNSFTGSIPDCVSKLKDLKLLYFDNLKMSGTIPDSIAYLHKLEYLYLNGNSFTGPLPSTIGHMTNLKHLFMNGNYVSGPLPDTVGALSGLQSLSFEGNWLTGSIPSTIGNLKKVERILLNINNMTGTIPSSLGNCNSLKVLLLQGNTYTGSFPDNIAKSLSNLVQLNLENNQFIGPMPTGFTSRKIQQINVRANFFSGSPAFVRDDGTTFCPKLNINSWVHSSIGGNCFTGKTGCPAQDKEGMWAAWKCQTFCGADSAAGACGGNGYCTLSVPKQLNTAYCVCDEGYVSTSNGRNCVLASRLAANALVDGDLNIGTNTLNDGLVDGDGADEAQFFSNEVLV